MSGPWRRRPRQRGVAVITALLLTTLAVTIVTSLFWQQQVQVRSMENQRLQLQTRWIVRGTLDFSRVVLFQDLLDSRSSFTRANGIWATPVEETRLDDYIERERSGDEQYNASFSGRMIDAQSRYNLGNLAKGRVVQAKEVEVFQRLLTNLQLNQSLAQAVALQVADAQQSSLPTGPGANPGAVGSNPNGSDGGSIGKPVQSASGGEPMEMVRIEDLLAVSGFNAQSVERLRDFVIVLPEPTTVNVNTAAPELIAALVPGMSLSEAAVVVNARKQAYYRSLDDFTGQGAMKAHPAGVAVTVGVKSDYFLAYSRVRLDRASLETQSLLRRAANGVTTVEWIREY